MRLSFTPFFGLAIAANLVDASLRGKANPSTDIAARELLDTRIVGGTQAAEGEFPFFGKLSRAIYHRLQLILLNGGCRNHVLTRSGMGWMWRFAYLVGHHIVCCPLQ
jgi:hypothetical protein